MDNKENFKSFFGKLSDFMVNYFNYKIVKHSGKEVTMVCPNHGQSQNNVKGLHLRVNDEKSLFFCNVCANTGNVHTGSYTEVVEACMNLTNKEAYKWLCKKAGIALNSNEEASVIDIRQEFVELCHKNLFKSQEAMAYLNKRGLSEKTIKRFRIGFSDSSELKEMKYSQAKLVQAGILKEGKNGKYYNVFRNRIVSMAGDNIYGRAIEESNIPHMYSQGGNNNALYNKNKAKDKDVVFIVESLFNAWTIEQYIFALCEKWGAIATLGTNGAKKEIEEFIKNSSPETEFIIIPDFDEWFKEKGVKHARGQIKALNLAVLIQKLNRSCRIMILEDNSDANDLSKNRVPVTVFRQMVETSVTPFEFSILFEKHFQDTKTFGGKKAFLEKIKNIMKVYPMEIKSEAIKLISSIVGLQEIEVKDFFKDDVKENLIVQYITNKIKQGKTKEEVFANIENLLLKKTK